MLNGNVSHTTSNLFKVDITHFYLKNIMNGRTVVVIVVVLLILIIGWAFYAQTSGEPNDLDGDFFGNNNNMDFVTQDVEGEITNIDRSQIIVDGPTLISLETEAGIQYEVAVP